MSATQKVLKPGPKQASDAQQVAGQIPGRVWARIAAALGNTLMVLYVYLSYLANEVQWGDFGRSRAVEMGQSQSLRDYIPADVEPALEHLRSFTFSEAMFMNLGVYCVVGTPVAITLIFLERSRIGWLKSLLHESLPSEQAVRAGRWLDTYLTSFSITLTFIMLIGPFHLGWPFMHYLCAVCAIGTGCASILLYLNTPVDLEVLAKGSDAAVWYAQTQRSVRPVLLFVLSLHVLTLASAVWKSERLGDDWVALVFGVFETMLVVGYQLFQGVFVWDDMMVAQRASRTKIEAKSPAPAEAKSHATATAMDAMLNDRMLGS